MHEYRISKSTAQKRKGFTLIELSIVLVIIGLIVGGVLVGQDLIRAAEMRSILSDRERFLTGINTYRLKYNAIPGDHNDAETFFGASATNNGDGNKKIDIFTTNDDSWLFWQHLSLAGLTDGTYTGDAATAYDGDAVIGTNVPAADRSGVGYAVYNNSSNTSVGLPPFEHLFVVGKDTTTTNTQVFGGAFLVAEVYVMDQKIDDGLANNGMVRAYLGNASHNSLGCTSGVGPNQVYNLSNTTAVCTLLLLFRP